MTPNPADRPAPHPQSHRAANGRTPISRTTYGRLTLSPSRIGDIARAVLSSTATTTAVRACRPHLLELVGVGPEGAAVLLIAAGDNPDQLTGEAAFAALCGVSPVEQSSGKTQRRRLNRGGNRQANAAFYRIVMTRIRWDDRTQAYPQRRTAQGLSNRPRALPAFSRQQRSPGSHPERDTTQGLRHHAQVSDDSTPAGPHSRFHFLQRTPGRRLCERTSSSQLSCSASPRMIPLGPRR
ncbi:transposase [Kitasatospora sp. NPDC050467]|uniref:transposase n=1 Tax=unclassified Kitasatospora TaxID=2633591 RepID=UPI0037B972EE